MKEIVYTTKVDTRDELLRRTMHAAACVREHPEMMQGEVNSWLNHGGHFEQLT
jgi:hypothetical protein